MKKLFLLCMMSVVQTYTAQEQNLSSLNDDSCSLLRKVIIQKLTFFKKKAENESSLPHALALTTFIQACNNSGTIIEEKARTTSNYLQTLIDAHLLKKNGLYEYEIYPDIIEALTSKPKTLIENQETAQTTSLENTFDARLTLYKVIKKNMADIKKMSETKKEDIKYALAYTIFNKAIQNQKPIDNTYITSPTFRFLVSNCFITERIKYNQSEYVVHPEIIEAFKIHEPSALQEK